MYVYVCHNLVIRSLYNKFVYFFPLSVKKCSDKFHDKNNLLNYTIKLKVS